MSRRTSIPSLPPAAEALRLFLGERLGGTVSLRITHNRSRVLWGKRSGSTWAVHLHEVFVDASPETWTAVARFIGRRDPAAGSELSRFIRQATPQIEALARPRRTVAVTDPAGQHHDLEAYRRGINESYFDGRIAARITWGRFAGRRGGRTMRLGSYDRSLDLIRVHPALDQPWVPPYFVASVVHHEMIHALLARDLAPCGRRRQLHSPGFRALERRYADHQRAETWEKENIHRLLRGYH